MTTKYAKFISNTYVQFPPQNKGSVCNYDKNIPLLIQDGYKEFFEVERPVTNRKYHIEYELHQEIIEVEVEPDPFLNPEEEPSEEPETQEEIVETILEVIVYDETQEEADERELESAKEGKISQNDKLRDEALLQGVTYEDVLFDSDTDQKVNLLATVSSMGDEDTIIWFGMDNQPLECTKLDLINIGGLITMLHSFCWERNYEIKAAINEAESIAELNEIVIDYTMPTSEPEEEPSEEVEKPEEPSEEPEE